ncbi:hypothetical protein GW17_00041033 [Ensete ventricosum]|nr:hypothetical protein GW17_00041033 [Ensete ventricosum]
MQVLFSSEKIGIGMGRTMKEAQSQAAENALRTLARDYVSFIAPVTSGVDTETTRHPCRNENGFLKENYGSQEESAKKEDLPVASTSENLK